MTTQPTISSGSNPLAAAGMILTGMALMGFVDNFVIVIAETTGIWQFQVIRSAMALSLLFVIARLMRWRLAPVRWLPVIGRSFIMSCALIIYFSALALMPISEAVAGLFTAPMFVLLFSVVLYRHRIGPARIAAVVVGFAGVLMVLKPDTGNFGMLTFLPVLSGVFYAMAMLSTREWCEGESPHTLLAGFFVAMGAWGIVGLVVLGIWPQEVVPGPDGFILRWWGDMSGVAWFWTAAQAVLSLIAVFLITRAYQIGEASHVTVFEYALLMFAVIWGKLIFGNTIDIWATLGILLIILSGTVIALRSRATA